MQRFIAAAILSVVTCTASAVPVYLTALHAGKAPLKFSRKEIQASSNVLYAQKEGSSGFGLVSQKFETEAEQFDSQAADDFVVPVGTIWRITSVKVDGGYYNGEGPVQSMRIVFYRDAGGKPGEVISEFPALTGGDNGKGSFSLKLPSPVRLKAGTYWFSAQANMNILPGGQWGWTNTRVKTGNAAVWRNPMDGFGTGCTDFTPEETCVNVGQGPDHVFVLRGKAR